MKSRTTLNIMLKLCCVCCMSDTKQKTKQLTKKIIAKKIKYVSKLKTLGFWL